MTKKIGSSSMRIIFIVVPALFLITSAASFFSSCSSGGLSNCTNTAPVANQTDCNSFASTYQCGSSSFDGTNCTVSNCQVCTCSGDVTDITDQQSCIQYANDNQCLTANVENGVCVVSECLNCETVV